MVCGALCRLVDATDFYVDNDPENHERHRVLMPGELVVCVEDRWGTFVKALDMDGKIGWISAPTLTRVDDV
jgi:hypothetical protein